MLAAAIFFAHWTRTREHPSLRRFVVWGALAGLAALMRWQDALFVLIPLFEAARWAVPATRRLAGGGATAVGFLLAFLPQMAVWTVLYGQPFALPQGSGFMQWTTPHLLAVLVSDNHGLFSWAPLLLLAALGLITFAVARPALGVPIGVIILATWYVNAAVADWWAGEAFGARRFLSLFPLFALGMAHWLPARPAATSWARGWKPGLAGMLVVANWLLLFQYQLFMKGYGTLAPYPEGWPDMWVTRFVVPLRVLRSWLW
jgi:hypothetical protein